MSVPTHDRLVIQTKFGFTSNRDVGNPGNATSLCVSSFGNARE